MRKVRKLILSMIIIFMAMPLYADKVLEPIIPIYLDKALEPMPTCADVTAPVSSPIKVLEPMPIINHTECTSFCDWVNIKNKDIKDDADTLRAEWKQALGVDVFFLHFKAKEITHKIEEKSQFKLFNMRGRATIKQDSATYTFSHKF